MWRPVMRGRWSAISLFYSSRERICGDVMCVLESERLILRPLRPTDIEAMTVWLSDYDVAKMTSRTPHPYNEDDAEAFLAREPDDEQAFAIERKGDGLFLGMAGFKPSEGHEFGYWLG